MSDDLKHDSAHALFAIYAVINFFVKSKDLFHSISVISDGAASHFKNRFQFNEIKNLNADIFIKWLFSVTGHGKGPVDAVGGVVKHYATVHNLQKDLVNSIENAEEFVTKVQNYTPSIKLLLLKSDDIAKFRENKKKDWSDVKELKGIQQNHVWYCSRGKDKTRLYIARTAEQTYVEVKERKNITKSKSKKKSLQL